MKQIAMAFVMFLLTAYCVSLAINGYRTGRMPLFFGHVFSLTFDRASNPAYFWSAAMFNAAIVAILGGGGMILLIAAAVHP